MSDNRYTIDELIRKLEQDKDIKWISNHDLLWVLKIIKYEIQQLNAKSNALSTYQETIKDE